MSSKRKAAPSSAAPLPNGGLPAGLDTDEIPVVTVRSAPSRPSLPALLKFPLVVLIAFSLTVLANTVLVELTGPQLYPVARNLTEDWQMGLVAGWKVLELGIAWFSGFDGLDMVCFTMLTRIPHAYLLNNFYLVPTAPLVVFLLSEAGASALPFHLLGRRNPHHKRSKNPLSASANPSDTTTYLLVSVVAAAMYALPVVLSLVTWLPLHLANTFYGLRTLDPAHTATLPMALALLLPLGLCAADFLFNSVVFHASTLPVEATSGSGEKTLLEFDPATATLAQTLHRNVFWHAYLPARTQALLRRATALVGWTAANTAFLAVVEVEGAEMAGALGWAGVWTVGAAAAGAMVGWIAGVAV